MTNDRVPVRGHYIHPEQHKGGANTLQRHPRQYRKNLSLMTSIRLSEEMRNDAEEAAFVEGISFSDFVRQAIRRNIILHEGIEKTVTEQNLLRAFGK